MKMKVTHNVNFRFIRIMFNKIYYRNYHILILSVMTSYLGT